jgi:catechol 2,3-dioxygenase-like lactoylglutathione lyase family enzyme
MYFIYTYNMYVKEQQMIDSMYPVLMVKDVSKMADFYVQHLGMETTFESDWYISLKLKTDESVFQLAVLQYDHPTVPVGFRTPSQGLILNFEVQSADEFYKRLIEEKNLPLHLDIRDEEFGQRHFISADPEGNLLDIIQIIEPSAEFLAQYTDGLQ